MDVIKNEYNEYNILEAPKLGWIFYNIYSSTFFVQEKLW